MNVGRLIKGVPCVTRVRIVPALFLLGSFKRVEKGVFRCESVIKLLNRAFRQKIRIETSTCVTYPKFYWEIWTFIGKGASPSGEISDKTLSSAIIDARKCLFSKP